MLPWAICNWMCSREEEDEESVSDQIPDAQVGLGEKLRASEGMLGLRQSDSPYECTTKSVGAAVDDRWR